MPTILNLIKTVTTALESSQETWWLLEKLTNKSKAELLAHQEINLTLQEQAQLEFWIKERVEKHKPLAYILGSVPFLNLEILVKPPILIPRPETEEWVAWLITHLQKSKIIKFTALDLCCGSGCIGLALAKAFPQAKIVGIDLSAQAIQLSQENRILNKIENIEFIQSDLYQSLPADFTCDLIVGNPPYLAKEEFEQLDLGVKEWEDRQALVASNHGMDFYHRILKDAKQFLNAKRRDTKSSNTPKIVLEIGPAQQDIEKLQASNFKKLEAFKDMQGKRRWICCWI